MGIAAGIGGRKVAADAGDSPDFPMCDTISLRCRFQEFLCAAGSVLKPAGAPTGDTAACESDQRGCEPGTVSGLRYRQALGILAGGMVPWRRIAMGVGCAGTPQGFEAVRSRGDLTSFRTVVGVYSNIARPNRREVG